MPTMLSPAQVGVGPIQWDENVAIYAKEFMGRTLHWVSLI